MILKIIIAALLALLLIGIILGAVVVRQINQAARDEEAMNGEPK